jgi:hypothetical protein
MIALIDHFAKELTDIAGFAASTVENYVACIAAFFHFTMCSKSAAAIAIGPMP